MSYVEGPKPHPIGEQAQQVATYLELAAEGFDAMSKGRPEALASLDPYMEVLVHSFQDLVERRKFAKERSGHNAAMDAEATVRVTGR